MIATTRRWAAYPLKWALRRTGYDLTKSRPGQAGDGVFPPDFTPDEIADVRFVEPYTMTSPERIVSLCRAAHYVVDCRIPGEVVECGVWKGGSMMAVARTLARLKSFDKHLYLFDTFEGMTEPTKNDVSFRGETALEAWDGNAEPGRDPWACDAPLREVQEALGRAGYDAEKVHFVKGRVEDTIPANAPDQIALLRLDTDWYESTRHELEHLFPRLVRGGVIIIDDYGHWEGARRATDEYLQREGISLLLNRIDYTGRIGVKI